MTGERAGLPLARPTLDRAAHRRTDEQWLATAWQRARVLVVDTAGGGLALVTAAEGSPELVLFDAGAVGVRDVGDRLFLGVASDGTPVFAIDAPLPTVPQTRAVALREVGHLLSDWDAGLFATAVALANWHLRHTYSADTGLPTVAGEGGWSRSDDAGGQTWPRTDPAMIVLVHDGGAGPAGRCLLGNNTAWPDRDGVRRFSCLAGYVEPGESAEAAVVREVGEEVGLALDESQIRYAGSQAWPYPGSLMLGFLAQADPEQPIQPDPAEISQARWFTRREIATILAGEPVDAGDGRRASLPTPASIAHFLLHRWLDEAVGERGLRSAGLR
ncbi:NAD(+) diphosphatase [Micromonospora polyrhachis]|uniref:NAD(+) diphosphatase n=1 Tax=Micromonospora polyrhachis TaxID=1282883 RepID=A0A7W7SSE0_9ACTN|nr:NAD(+) diphosphatase [Micromonospora polyrhachis]MBB4960088.1 NAD+ diphosphatase [Micromonospora polyrhachis]